LRPPEPAEKWSLIERHCQLAIEEWGDEEAAMRSMRGRLMAYSKGMPASKLLREKFQRVSKLTELQEIANESLEENLQPA
jgi:tRNA-dihydrouridine synthase B